MPRRPLFRSIQAGALSAAVAWSALAGAARAQEDYTPPEGLHPRGEFALGIGYTRISLDGGGPLLEGRDGIHFEPVVSFAPFDAVPQLRLGAAVGWSLALDDTRGAAISHNGNLFVVTTSDVTFMLIEPELRLSWRQSFAHDSFFIEPGVAAGAAIGWVDVGDAASDHPDAADANSFTEWDTSFEAKVFLRAGTHFDNGMAGIEASYMRAGTLEFADNMRGKPEEFYFGIFGSLQF
jgi:hypothetical protein